MAIISERSAICEVKKITATKMKNGASMEEMKGIKPNSYSKMIVLNGIPPSSSVSIFSEKSITMVIAISNVIMKKNVPTYFLKMYQSIFFIIQLFSVPETFEFTENCL